MKVQSISTETHTEKKWQGIYKIINISVPILTWKIDFFKCFQNPLLTEQELNPVQGNNSVTDISQKARME